MTYDLDQLNSALVPTMYSGKLRYFDEIGSTNTEAMKAAAEGAPEGAVFLTDQQNRGRGRNGHGWISERGTSVLVSIVVRPAISSADTLWLSLITGLAVRDAVMQTTGVVCDLRWPNDLLVQRRKVCGILTELSTEQTRVRFAVVGVGINVNQTAFDPLIAELATSLRKEAGKSFSRQELLLALLRNFESEYRALLQGNTQRLLTRLESASSYVRGKRVHVDEAGGYLGVTTGLDDRGFLLVETAEGIRRVLSGGVRERDS